MTRPDPIDANRARLEAGLLSDGQLRRLYAAGPSGMRPEAWEAIEEEAERRRSDAEALIVDELVDKRYPALRIVVFVIKAFSVLIVGVGAFVVLVLPPESGLFGLAVGFGCLWAAILNWAAGELITIQIDIEANTRALRHPVRVIR